MDSLRKNFKKILKEKGITQLQVAEAAGISASQISRIARFRESTELGSLRKLANGLGISLAELLSAEAPKGSWLDNEKARSLVSQWSLLPPTLQDAIMEITRANVEASKAHEPSLKKRRTR